MVGAWWFRSSHTQTIVQLGESSKLFFGVFIQVLDWSGVLLENQAVYDAYDTKFEFVKLLYVPCFHSQYPKDRKFMVVEIRGYLVAEVWSEPFNQVLWKRWVSPRQTVRLLVSLDKHHNSKCWLDGLAWVDFCLWCSSAHQPRVDGEWLFSSYSWNS